MKAEAHSLKDSCRTIGADAMAAICQEMESLGAHEIKFSKIRDSRTGERVPAQDVEHFQHSAGTASPTVWESLDSSSP